MMAEYLYRISVDFDYFYKGKKDPVYAVGKSVKDVKDYVNNHIAKGCTIKSVALLGERLGMNMYHGKPKKDSYGYKEV